MTFSQEEDNVSTGWMFPLLGHTSAALPSDLDFHLHKGILLAIFMDRYA
jgi:hypothetical protein